MFNWLHYGYECKASNKLRKKAKKRIDKNLDIIRFIRNQVTLELLMKVRFSRLENYFLKNNRKYVLNLSDKKDE